MKKIIIRFNAPVILSFALLSLIALLLGNWTNGAATTQYFSVYRSSLADPLTYVRFFGHVLGHSGYDHYMGTRRWRPCWPSGALLTRRGTPCRHP